MARHNCSSSSPCSCVVEGSTTAVVSGAGSGTDPYVIGAAISGDAGNTLTDQNGLYVPTPATGTSTVVTGDGITGDGSTGSPLMADLSGTSGGNSGMVLGPAGFRFNESDSGALRRSGTGVEVTAPTLRHFFSKVSGKTGGFFDFNSGGQAGTAQASNMPADYGTLNTGVFTAARSGVFLSQVTMLLNTAYNGQYQGLGVFTFVDANFERTACTEIKTQQDMFYNNGGLGQGQAFSGTHIVEVNAGTQLRAIARMHSTSAANKTMEWYWTLTYLGARGV